MPLAHNVHRGAKLLDEKMPGWFQKIDLDKLCMSNGTVCVLGQLFETEYLMDQQGYEIGIDELRLTNPQVVDYGFCLPDPRVASFEIRDIYVRWQELDRLWMAEVKARFDAGFEV